MKNSLQALRRSLPAAIAALLTAACGPALAKVEGITGPTFNLVAREAYLITGDGNTVYGWGYGNGAGPMQYPGPTLIVNQGDTVTVNLTNTLPTGVSMIFPGQQGVVAAGGTAGLLTNEVGVAGCTTAPACGQVSYTFTATQPGTYMYHSGTNPSLQVDMGLVGTIIIRPNVADPAHQAYSQPNTGFDREFLFLLSDMDAAMHDRMSYLVQTQRQLGLLPPYDFSSIDTSAFYATLWFINGRNSPDTLIDANVRWLPNQPYNAAPKMHPGEKVLMRMVAAGRDLHPFHHHGAHALPIARDGRVLESAPGAGPDLSSPDFTVRSIPGQTLDLIFEWTGQNIGWDVYGPTAHTCNGIAVNAANPQSPGFDPATHEYCPDHGKAFPVILPNQQDVQFGEYYSGSPYLGKFGILPQGHPGLNVNGGYYHIWHSHNEKEITTNNVFPGGMKTFLIIEAPSVVITE